MHITLVLFAALPGVSPIPAAPNTPTPDRAAGAAEVAARIDAIVNEYWKAESLSPAAAVDDPGFLRRLTLDLVGRIPTRAEAAAFAADQSRDKRSRAVSRLMNGPEYPRHLGRLLDEAIQGKFAGDPEFLGYVREAVAARTPWDVVFREVMLGPWETPRQKGARKFLLQRQADLDLLTVDTAVVFFGVNVSCAKCHDHPLVPDWTQDHFYGMASFLNRTYEASKEQNGRDKIREKEAGPVSYVTTKGARRTAKMMYLSGEAVEPPAAAVASAAPAHTPQNTPAAGSPGAPGKVPAPGQGKKSETPPPPKAEAKNPGQLPVSTPGQPARRFSPREELVRVALEDKVFFRRAIVNRLWAAFMGRGLVSPVDQMHSSNLPAIPDVLEALADDFADHHYDLDRVVAGLVNSRMYQLSTVSRVSADPAKAKVVKAEIRALSPDQYAASFILACGDGGFEQNADRPAARHWLDGAADGLTRHRLLDHAGDHYQASTGEALFMSNHPDVQRLVTPDGRNLASRLADIKDNGKAVDEAVWSIYSRPPDPDERAFLVRWLESRPDDRGKACGELVWAMLTSAEFRLNH